ncbi:DNA-binding response regulator [Lewinellaceae bacterium SD302]|nr:DNA-binding response regulator [Lewinellaceae bacterium SD302]
MANMAANENGISILIVEDESIVALDIADYLDEFGYRVCAQAVDGASAIRLFTEKQTDLVLMDVHLQGKLDGIETAQQLMQIRRVPLIYLTAQADIQTTTRAKLTEPSAYLLKPFDGRSLRIAIDLALHNFTGNTVHNSFRTEEALSLTADVLLRKGNALYIKQQGKFVKIDLGELLYCQADGIYTDLISVTKKYALRMSMTNVIDKLSQTDMVRIHRSFAVNLGRVDSLSDREVTVAGKPIPIGNAYKEDFLRRFDLL